MSDYTGSGWGGTDITPGDVTVQDLQEAADLGLLTQVGEKYGPSLFKACYA